MIVLLVLNDLESRSVPFFANLIGLVENEI